MDSAESSVKFATHACLSKFTDVIKLDKIRNRYLLEDKLADLRLWVHSVGAMAKPGASLDSRFKDRASDLALVKSILDLLTDCLSEYCALVANGSSTAEILDNIDTSIRNLAMIGVAIRQTGKASRSRKIDKLYDPAEHQEFRRHLECIALLRPSDDFASRASALESSDLNEIQERIIEANLRRRHVFILAQKRSHHAKKSDPIIESPETRIDLQAEPMVVSHDKSPTQVIDQEKAPFASLPQHHVAKINKSAIVGDLSKASTAEGTLRVNLLKERKSMPTIARTQISVIASNASFPEPPLLSGDRLMFACPCCCQSLPSEKFRDSTEWRKHLIQDLRPYTCIAENCPSPYLLFTTRKAWEIHIKNDHPVQWQCPICVGDEIIFSKEHDLVDHLQTRHQKDLMDQSISDYTAWSTFQFMGIRSCPLCSSNGPTDSPELVSHVVQHAYEFALRALPWPKVANEDMNKPIGTYSLPEKREDAKRLEMWIDECNRDSTNTKVLQLSSYDTADHASGDDLGIDQDTDYFAYNDYFEDQISENIQPSSYYKVDLASGDILSIMEILPEHLWDRAYDELKETETEAAVVQAYEKILSRHLCDRDPTSDSDIDEENIIAQDDPGARRAQMKRLITSGLAKIKRETKIKESLNSGVQVILSAKDVISSAIQAVPQAALAWTGLCVALEIFGNTASATKANRDGIDYVIQRMAWYWELPDTILRENAGVYNHLSKMKGGLEAQLIGLYKLLLLYQMKSVCSEYKNRGLFFLRDLAKLDDWDGDIKAVEKAEAIFYQDSDVHRKEKMNANLEETMTYVKQKMTKEDLQCFKDLGITDPSYDKKRIESTKGGLLEESYRWVLDNPDFRRWRDDKDTGLLWIKGDPGKGKTMLLCGIANELRKMSDHSSFVSYFFCEEANQRINSANAVLWGLMFMLVDQQPVLMHHIRSKYDKYGKDIFLGENSWFALSEIFSVMLSDPALTHAYLIIDALDECTSNRERLLDLVVKNISASSRVKWILSSRNWPEIERQLAKSDLQGVSLWLEVNAALVFRAVDAYIEHEISQLRLIEYPPTLKDQIRQQMQAKANGTFLWVALVIKHLRDRQGAEYKDPSYLLDILVDMPEGLSSLYSFMVHHIVTRDTPSLCERILSVAALASRPLSLAELRILAGFDSNRINDEAVEKSVNQCGSFVRIHDRTIYFVHQSAKDFLMWDATIRPIIFSSGHNEVHYMIFSHSLRAMSSTLKGNIYMLPHPRVHVDEIETPDPDPLAAIRYSCSNWVDHLRQGISDNDNSKYQDCFSETGLVFIFLRTHFLHWLEALSLLGRISDSINFITKLENSLKGESLETLLAKNLRNFLQDAHHFIMKNVMTIELTPLQVYSPEIMSSPPESLIRRIFFEKNSAWNI